MSDLWIDHIADSIDAANPDPEIVAELETLAALRDEVFSIYTEAQNELDKIGNLPASITAYIEEHASSLLPITLTVFQEEPIQYLLSTSAPLSIAIADEMDNRWPGVIILEQAPV